ncbi:MAG: hypothetical protein ACXW0J_07125 [Nitrososphaeraceae archaeon]
MKLKIINTALLLIFCTTVIVYFNLKYAQYTQPKSTNTEVEIKAKPWQPIAFSLEGDHLPPNYMGLDPKEFLELFESRINSFKLTKDEFETTEEFEKRIANKDAILFPLNTSTLYAFRINSIPVKYDADTQVYVIGNEYIGCHNANSYYLTSDSKDDWYTCKVDTIFNYSDSYTGSNAFGISLPITRTISKEFSLAIKKNRLFDDVFDSKKYQDEYIYTDKVFIPIEKARSLRNMSIAVLFVGQINGTQIIQGKGYRKKPTIDSPTEIIDKEYAVPFNLTKVYYYVIESGEIIEQRDFSDPIRSVAKPKRKNR